LVSGLRTSRRSPPPIQHRIDVTKISVGVDATHGVARLLGAALARHSPVPYRAIIVKYVKEMRWQARSSCGCF
jgi:hypothetical protein